MASNGYLVVDKSILPACYEKVIEARNLLEEHKVKEVTEAVAAVGISRSTYYKYKDLVFALGENDSCQKVVINFNISHQMGMLSEVLALLSANGGNILTLNTTPPINGHAHAVVTLDISNLHVDLDSLTERLASIDGVTDTHIVAVER